MRNFATCNLSAGLGVVQIRKRILDPRDEMKNKRHLHLLGYSIDDQWMELITKSLLHSKLLKAWIV